MRLGLLGMVMVIGLVPAARADLAIDCAESTAPLERIEFCTRVIKDPEISDIERSRAYNNRGLAYEALGRIDTALDNYNIAIDLDPGSAPAFNNRGNIHATRGELRRALEDHTEAIRLDPDYSHAYYNRAVDLEEIGEPTLAIEDYTRVLEIDPNYGVALVSRGTLQCRIGAAEAAVADLVLAVQRGFVDATAMQQRLSQTGHYSGPIDGDFGAGSQGALRAWVGEGCPG